jgi:uncharacterized membrane protein
MQCPSCHNEVAPQATFCGFCGAQLNAASAAPASGPTPAGYAPVGGGVYAAPAAAAPAAPAVSVGGLSENAAAAISYLTIIPAIIFLVIEPYNRMRLVRFHAMQSIALAVAWIAIWIAITIIHIALHFIPFISVLFLLVDLAISVGFFIAWLFCILKASKGEYFKLPIIGDFAAKQANS